MYERRYEIVNKLIWATITITRGCLSKKIYFSRQKFSLFLLFNSTFDIFIRTKTLFMRLKCKNCFHKHNTIMNCMLFVNSWFISRKKKKLWTLHFASFCSILLQVNSLSHFPKTNVLLFKIFLKLKVFLLFYQQTHLL